VHMALCVLMLSNWIYFVDNHVSDNMY